MGGLDFVTSSNGAKLTNADSVEVFSNHHVQESNESLHPPQEDLKKVEQTNSSRCTYLWWSILLDLPLFVLFIAVVTIFTGRFIVVLDYKAGFFCNDPALSYPFNGDTVSAAFLMISVVLGPLAVMLLTELICIRRNTFPYSTSDKTKHALIKIAKVYRTYFFGFIANICFVMIVKTLMGRPRPHFFDVCQPDTGKTCNGTEFVSTFKCTSSYHRRLQIDGYQSFPSGHTSLAVYAGFYTILYLQHRAYNWRNKSGLLVPTLQFLCLMYSSICSFTRITDRRHHWWDVLGGFGLGFAFVYFVVVMQLKNFSVMKKSRTMYEIEKYDSKNTSNLTEKTFMNSDFSIKM